MSRRLRSESVARPYGEEFGAIGDRVADDMFGELAYDDVFGGSAADYSIDPRTGQLVRAAKSAPPDQDPEAAAHAALKSVRADVVDNGARVATFQDLSGTSYAFWISRSAASIADGYAQKAAREHQVTALRLTSTTDRTAIGYVFTTHELWVRSVARLRGYTSQVLYQPTG